METHCNDNMNAQRDFKYFTHDEMRNLLGSTPFNRGALTFQRLIWICIYRLI